jgi:hypothetical protein
VSISDAECVTALKFFGVLLDMAKRLEAIGATYTTSGKRKTDAARTTGGAMIKLSDTQKEAVAQMPGYE